MEQRALEGNHSATIPLEEFSSETEFVSSDAESAEEPLELEDLELDDDPSVRTRVRSRSRSVRASGSDDRTRLMEG